MTCLHEGMAGPSGAPPVPAKAEPCSPGLGSVSLLEGNEIQKESMKMTLENVLRLSAVFGKGPVVWDP